MTNINMRIAVDRKRLLKERASKRGMTLKAYLLAGAELIELVDVETKLTIKNDK